jgi:hypothetical protein
MYTGSVSRRAFARLDAHRGHLNCQMGRRTPQQTRSIDIQAMKAAGYFKKADWRHVPDRGTNIPWIGSGIHAAFGQ